MFTTHQTLAVNFLNVITNLDMLISAEGAATIYPLDERDTVNKLSGTNTVSE